ncbi:MAG: DEAD/DEAH box helicase [Phycisphaerales bacterium]
MNETTSAGPDAAPSTFDSLGIPPLLVASLAREGAVEPTRVQREAIPPALEGRDLAAVAATGTGKTLAFLLPVATRLLLEPPPRPRGRPVDPRRRMRALVLCPTRELAQQVARDASQLLRGTVLRAGAVYGKSALAPQRDLVRSGLDILVGTPGRVKELCELDALSLAFVRHVVLDEADRMLDMGFLPQAREILSRAPEDRQLLFFTATMPRPVEAIVEELLRAPVRLDLVGRAPGTVEGTPAPRTDKGQHLYDVEDEDKSALTVALIKDGKRSGTIVFCRTRRRAGWVAAALRRHELRTAVIHGDRSQRQRQEALAEFAAGRAAVLVATDVAARGLHVPAVRTVINYDVPLLPEEYVHRIGRAGHGGGVAEAITLRSPVDRERWVQIERTVKRSLVAERPPEFRAYSRVGVGIAPDAERLVRTTRGGSPAIERVRPGAKQGAKPGAVSRAKPFAKPASKPNAKPGIKPTGKPHAKRGAKAGAKPTEQRPTGAPSPGALIRMGNAAAARVTKGRGGRRTGDGVSMRGSDRARKLDPGQKPGGGVRRGAKP